MSTVFFNDPNFQVCEFQNLRKTKCWRLWSFPSLRYDTKLAVSVLKVEYIYWSPKVMMPVSRPVWSSEIIGLHQKSLLGSIWWNGAISIHLGVCLTLFRGFGEEEPTVEMVGIIARVDLQSAEGSDWPQGRESFNALTTIQFVKKKHCTKL